MIWDQTYGDFGTYEEAQITTAAKGADAMNPGVTMNLVVKSGSNTFKGLGSANYQSGDFQSDNVTHELLAKGYAPGVNKFTKLQGLLRRSRRPDPEGSRCGSTPATATRRPATSFPASSSLSDREQVEFYTKLQDPTGKITYQITQEQQVRRHVPGRPQVAAVSHARAASCRSNRRRTRTRGR